MGYRVGIDFGTTTAVAAAHRDGEERAALVPLGDNGAAVASIVYVAPDGGLVMGDAAARRAAADPDRVVRAVARHVGDQTPLRVGDDRWDAHTIAACFVRWVVDRVSAREGAPPDGIALAHPASWGAHTCALMTTALAAQGIDFVRLVVQPVAAAHGCRHGGTTVGVYDLGGGTFDAAVVRATDDGFVLAGRPERLGAVGGDHVDDLVLAHVTAALGPQWTDAAPAALRRECVVAKEALSTATEVTVPVLLPGLSTRVRLTRRELDDLIAPAVAETVAATRRACASAGVAPEDLSSVLLVGGSTRIPFVARRVAAALGCRVVVDDDPGAVVARGAALAIAPVPDWQEKTVVTPAVAVAPAAPRRSRRALTVGAGVVACVAAVVVVTAGAGGTDLVPRTPGAAAALPREVAGQEPVGLPAENGDDPWTGAPYRETTAPGPTRAGAEPATASPAALTPAPTTGGDRDARIEGEPPATPPASPIPTALPNDARGDAPSTQLPAPAAPPTTAPDETPAPPPTTEDVVATEPPPAVETPAEELDAP